MLSLLYLVVRALVGFLVGGGQQGRDDGSKDLTPAARTRTIREARTTAPTTRTLTDRTMRDLRGVILRRPIVRAKPHHDDHIVMR